MEKTLISQTDVHNFLQENGGEAIVISPESGGAITLKKLGKKPHVTIPPMEFDSGASGEPLFAKTELIDAIQQIVRT